MQVLHPFAVLCNQVFTKSLHIIPVAPPKTKSVHAFNVPHTWGHENAQVPSLCVSPLDPPATVDFTKGTS